MNTRPTWCHLNTWPAWMNLIEAGKPLCKERGSNACIVIHLLKNWLFVQRIIVYFISETTRLVDHWMCGILSPCTETSWFRCRFHKRWVYGVKRRVQPNLGENAISWAYGANAWCQIRIIFCKKDGHRAPISIVGRKLLFEIHPCCNRYFQADYKNFLLSTVQHLYQLSS
jgi:hypothetical protein